MFGFLRLLLPVLGMGACEPTAPPTMDATASVAGEPVVGPVRWRPASRGDLAPGTLEAVTGPDGREPLGGTSVQVDLDGDGADDTARLEVDVHRQVRLRLLARGVDLDPVHWPALHADQGGAVATWLSAKPPGDAVLRESLDPADAEALSARGAVEVCEPPAGPQAVSSAPAEQRCYCSSWWWIEQGKARSLTACD